MITPQQPVKEGHFLRALRRRYGEGFQSAEPAFDRRWRWVLADRQSAWAPRATVIGGPLAGWQAKQAFLLQLQQHRAAGHVLEPPHFISPPPVLRNVLGELRAVPVPTRLNEFTDPLQILGL